MKTIIKTTLCLLLATVPTFGQALLRNNYTTNQNPTISPSVIVSNGTYFAMGTLGPGLAASNSVLYYNGVNRVWTNYVPAGLISTNAQQANSVLQSDGAGNRYWSSSPIVSNVTASGTVNATNFSGQSIKLLAGITNAIQFIVTNASGVYTNAGWIWTSANTNGGNFLYFSARSNGLGSAYLDYSGIFYAPFLKSGSVFSDNIYNQAGSGPPTATFGIKIGAAGTTITNDFSILTTNGLASLAPGSAIEYVISANLAKTSDQCLASPLGSWNLALAKPVAYCASNNYVNIIVQNVSLATTLTTFTNAYRVRVTQY